MLPVNFHQVELNENKKNECNKDVIINNSASNHSSNNSVSAKSEDEEYG